MKKNLNKKIISLVAIFTVSFFIFSHNAFAIDEELEGYGLGGIPQELNMNVLNEAPGPNEEVSISIENYSINLYTSQISWYKNNILVEKGVGKKSFSFSVGELGTSDTITVIVLTKDGKQFIKSKTFVPAEVDLIWESNSYTPPIYKGKTITPYRAVVKLVAIPNFINQDGSKINDDELMYVWKKDWKIINGSQGIGKNVLYFDMAKDFRDGVLSVEVSTTDNSVRAKTSVRINESSPKIIFYENDPLLGIIFEKALDQNLDLLKEEITISAQPFFFSKDDIKNDKLIYKWKLNSKLLNDVVGDFITLKKGEDKGTANLSLNIQDKNRVMQSATNVLNINFDDDRASLFNF
ncbi:MAG: hypothetical protein PHX25_03150 [Candidatus Pacebacteria bacterium]|nr:hypothetical protein [Candidatus Paceibacterota bacterium]